LAVLRGIDAHITQLAYAGSDRVSQAVLLHQFVHHGPGGIHFIARLFCHFD
jgi:hypothetical protein